jgi:hypothetical protein
MMWAALADGSRIDGGGDADACQDSRVVQQEAVPRLEARGRLLREDHSHLGHSPRPPEGRTAATSPFRSHSPAIVFVVFASRAGKGVTWNDVVSVQEALKAELHKVKLENPSGGANLAASGVGTAGTSKPTLPCLVYLPTNPDTTVLSVNYEGASPMQSAVKSPILVPFLVETRSALEQLGADVPDPDLESALSPRGVTRATPSSAPFPSTPRGVLSAKTKSFCGRCLCVAWSGGGWPADGRRARSERDREKEKEKEKEREREKDGEDKGKEKAEEKEESPTEKKKERKDDKAHTYARAIESLSLCCQIDV